MLSVRVSTVEKFRRMIRTEWQPEVDLISYIQAGQQGPQNWRMAAGTAWAKVLEYPDETRVLNNEGFHGHNLGLFSAADVELALAHLGPGLREVTGRMHLDVGGTAVCVEGTCDQIDGLLVQDDKLTFDDPDPANYFDSLQWRMYLLIHGGSVFRYNLWSFKEPTPDGLCVLEDVDSFRVWPYAGMREECVGWVREFVDWAYDKRLLQFLTPKREVVT